MLRYMYIQRCEITQSQKRPGPQLMSITIHSQCIMSRFDVPHNLRTRSHTRCFVLLVGCLTSQQHASVPQGRICSDKCTCWHTEIEVADQTFFLTQSQYTNFGPTSPSTDPISPGAWQGSNWSSNFLSHWYDSTQKNPVVSGIRTPDLPLPSQTP